MTKHANKFLLVAVVGLAAAWLSAELRVRSLTDELSRLDLREFSVESRDAVTGDLLQTVIGPPNKEDSFPLLSISSVDGKSMRVLCASSTPLTFRISSPGYAEETLTIDRHPEATAVVRLKKL